ncbi:MULTISPECIES: YozE family protein [Latilactobacillus]|jgi:uncharacterized protein YozE (UPF0346 family)|uniref:UPF0346 protein CG419_05960 n=2 Tax=Latilactobacillus curvatus TaxID=28038 RepID=A0A0B2XL75_LATCU|nr:YozE family protein [Latilactobacillus curvatus]MDT3393463.1 YozE family protein [Bacillota bacterium]ANJ69306.1 hypothetical protein FBA2_04650 [Latilactobacillus curvatus]ANY13903.1 hypothetical protein BCY75_07860 [Latilactobacillus curvatus]AOO75558.1 hypothetical protein LCW_05545 [Latilactobacillus curvatus]ASN60207.1 YozE family protein [Latilactobacillus curvatus]
MKQSFYRYLMTQRDPNNYEPVPQFANNAFFDQSFPKQSGDYETLTRYLELNGSYLPSMTIFDEAYEAYQESEQA